MTRVRIDGRTLQGIARGRRASSRTDGQTRPRHGLLKPAGVDDIDLGALERDLSENVRGEVHTDPGHRAIYSHDSSNYRQAPLAVVLPRDADDVIGAVAAARAHGAPVLPRGAGTSLSGETCNVAVVIDCSRHMRRILDVDPERRIARVQPGVVRDQLSDRTEAQHRLTFAPDTSTHAYATLGGMLGNNSCGVHSLMAGRTSDNTHELDVVLYDGTRMRVGETSDAQLQRVMAEGGRRGEIYRRLHELRERHADAIRASFPDIPRRVSGYNLDELLPEKGFNLARLLVGSEGTLATVLDATVRLVDSPPYRTLVVLGFPDIFEAADAVPSVLEHRPVGLEGMDARLLHGMRAPSLHVRETPMLPPGGGWLLTEFAGWSREEADEGARACCETLADPGSGVHAALIDDPEQQRRIWEMREAGLGAASYMPGGIDHWPGWEDAAVPPEREGAYLREFDALLHRYDYRAALYGHFGDGCIHCRISFDLRSAGGLRKWRAFLDEAADLVVSYGGSLSGEHGDGQQRAELLPKMYPPEIIDAFREVKSIFDPGNRMNPHKVVDPYPIVSNLKLGADYAPAEPDTHLHFGEDGGSFAHAALRCVGAGKCLDTARGTMCPSYMATRDEKHTTRGRARILYEMLQGDTITDGFRSQDVMESLDLCLSCKGCKTDCPVNVDMAAYKAEFLSKHYKGRLRPPAAYSMGLIMFHARAAMVAPRAANLLTHAPGISQLVKRAGGIAPERPMPGFARESFRSWWARRGTVNPDGPKVVLFADTFNDHLHPQVLKDTAEALESAGCSVDVPQGFLCCGRPLFDYGMLPTARRFLEHLVGRLRDHARAGTYVVGAEPSCVSTFRDELTRMLPHDQDAKRLGMQTLTLGEFLLDHAPEGWEPPRLERRAVAHGHCQQKGTVGFDAEPELLRRMGMDVSTPDTGCCGMAGSFGFEAGEKFEVSKAVAEHRFLPIVRAAPADAVIVADGFSCKTQMEHLGERRGLHLAQVMALARRFGPDGPSGIHPEQHVSDR